MRWTRIIPLAAVSLGLSTGVAHADPIAPYAPPPFADACTVHSFGEGESPDLAAYSGEDPLCVEYAKRDITVDDGGAVAFLLAEPARIALAAPVCQYWQQDHWSVQFSRGDVPVVRWDGSYWFDKGSGQAAGRLRHLTVGGQPVGVDQVAELVAPASPDLAAYLRTFGRGDSSGTTADAGVPLDPRCVL
jgi:hypothetical protein